MKSPWEAYQGLLLPLHPARAIDQQQQQCLQRKADYSQIDGGRLWRATSFMVYRKVDTYAYFQSTPIQIHYILFTLLYFDLGKTMLRRGEIEAFVPTELQKT
jgi:hypothetical protein